MIRNKKNISIFLGLSLIILSNNYFIIVGASFNDSINWPTSEWLKGNPNDYDLDGSAINDMLVYLNSTTVSVEHVTVSKDGYMLAEYYNNFKKSDDNFTFYHIVKGITAILTGIAIDLELIEGVDDKVLSFFNEDNILNVNDQKRAITLKHLLTCTSGFEWDEDNVPYSYSSNDFNIWRRSNDWAKYVLDLPVVANPGEVFEYNSGTTHLLNCVLKQKINTTILEFATKYLFDPLGIKPGSWSSDPNGVHDGASGIHLSAHDSARLGLLLINSGNWNGKQIVSSDYVDDMFTDHYNVNYGYQFWLENSTTYSKNVWTCAGPFDAKKITLIMNHRVVATITCFAENEWSKKLLTDYIIPSLPTDQITTQTSPSFIFMTILFVFCVLTVRKQKDK